MLYLDAGNTRVKAARWNGSGWESASEWEADAAQGRAVGVAVVASARDRWPLVRWLRLEDVPAARMGYGTPQTLGLDRFAACAGAWAASGTDVVVVDAGTAVTIDHMDAAGVFRGGVIMPGLRLFEDSLQRHAPALPAVERGLPASWPPASTADALRWGLTGSWIAAVSAHVDRFRAERPHAEVWVTGGDAALLGGVGRYEPWLVLDGLRRLMPPQHPSGG